MQEGGAGGFRAQDPALSFLAQILFPVAQGRYRADQGFGLMRVEVVDDENPFPFQVGGHRLYYVVGEVLFGARRRHRGAYDVPRGDLEVGDQTLRAVADLVLLPALDAAGNGEAGRMGPFQGLHAGFLVATDQMDSLFMELGGVRIQEAHRTYLVVKLFGVPPALRSANSDFDAA